MTIDNHKGFRIDSNFLPKPIQSIDYKELLNQYFLRKWYWYVLSVIIFVGLAYFYGKIVEPQFEIKSKLLIIKEEGESYPTDDWVKRSMNFTAVPENVYNEIQILTSFALVYDVVNKLDLDIHYFWKEGMAQRDGYGNFPITVEDYELTDPKFEGVPFEIHPVDQHAFNFIQKDSIIGTYRFDEAFSNPFGSFCFSAEDPLPAPTEDRAMFVEFFHPDAVTEAYLDNLMVDFIDIKSTTLELKLEDAVPGRGVALLENLIEGYRKIKHAENNKVAYNTLQFIDERLYDIGGDLRSIERSLESYKLNNDIAGETTSDLNLILDNVNKLSKEQEDLQVQMSILESTKSGLNAGGNDFELIQANVANTNVQIQQMVKSYNDLVLERRQLLVTSQPSNPLVQSAEQRMTSLRNSISMALNNLQNDQKIQLTNIKNQYDRSLERLKSVPTKERQMVDKSRQQNIIENLYIYLLQKREETALSLIGLTSNSLVIDPPRSSVEAISPNKYLLVFAGGLLGMGFPFVFIALGVLLKDSVQSEEDVKEIFANTPANVVGYINRCGGNKKKVVQNQARTAVADRFRSLRTNLQFLHDADTSTKTILVTSSTSNEGKSFVASNLAVSFAASQEKTILLDFDLRNPSAAKSLGEGENVTIGLGNFLLGEVSDLKEVIQHSGDTENLDYITVGKVSSNPAEIILSEKRLSTLFGFLKEHYDVIVIDTSPVGIVSDAILLNRYLTSTLYVVREGFTKKKMLEDARDSFEQDKLQNPSIVLNGIKKQKGYYGYYGI